MIARTSYSKITKMLTKAGSPAEIDDHSIDYTYMYVYSCFNMTFFQTRILINKNTIHTCPSQYGGFKLCST